MSEKLQFCIRRNSPLKRQSEAAIDQNPLQQKTCSIFHNRAECIFSFRDLNIFISMYNTALPATESHLSLSGFVRGCSEKLRKSHAEVRDVTFWALAPTQICKLQHCTSQNNGIRRHLQIDAVTGRLREDFPLREGGTFLRNAAFYGTSPIVLNKANVMGEGETCCISLLSCEKLICGGGGSLPI